MNETRRSAIDGSRGMTSVVGIVLLIAVVVLVATTVSVVVFDLGSDVQSKAPYIETSHELVADQETPDDDWTVAITLRAGDRVESDRLYVAGSKPVDVGGPPGTAGAANDQWASSVENLMEPAGGPAQVGIGETWDAGETVYVDPDGRADGVRISVYWVAGDVSGQNPGEPIGDDAYRLTTVTVTAPDG